GPERPVTAENGEGRAVPSSIEDSEFRGFGALSRLMNMGVLVLDTDASLEFANALAAELFGAGDPAELKRRWPELRAQLGLAPESLCAGATPDRRVSDVEAGGRTRSLRLEIYGLDPEACSGYLVLVK